MNREQINRIYASAPAILWPWVWVQLIVILAKLEAASMRGEDATVLIGITRWFSLHILYQSDNLSGVAPHQNASYAGNVTFASLCETPHALWTPFTSALITFIAAYDNACEDASTPEYAEALRPVP